jgi:hypothetical protein
MSNDSDDGKPLSTEGNVLDNHIDDIEIEREEGQRLTYQMSDL